MKKILLTAAALTMIAAPAFAQSDSSSVTLNASVAGMCELSTNASNGPVNINLIPANAGSIVDADGTLKANVSQAVPLSAFIGSTPTAWCNGAASKVTIEVDGLTNSLTNNNTAEFDNYIDLALEDWTIDGTNVGGATSASGATATTGPLNMGRPFSGAFDGNIRFVDTGRKLLAGSYAGSFTITIAAN